MKLSKIFTIALAAVTLTACSDDDDFNTASNVTVGMLNTEVSVKETKGLFDVPVVVTGEANGPIAVTIAVQTTGSSIAEENVHYVITTKHLNIPAGVKEVNVEVNTIDDGDQINEPRQFQVVITDCKGATVGQPSTLVTIKDSDAAFYEKLQGKWTFNCINSNGSNAMDVTITGAADEDDPDYDSVLYMSGWQGYAWVACGIEYNYDIATRKGSLYFPFGQIIAEGVNFGGSIGVCEIALGTLVEQDGKKYISIKGGVEATWSDDFKTINFPEDALFYGWLVSDGKTNGYSWFSYSKCSATKK